MSISGNNYLKAPKICFENVKHIFNQARSKTCSCPRISSLWDASLSSGIHGEQKKQEAASRLQNRQFSNLSKAAALLALPVLGAVAWSLMSGSHPSNNLIEIPETFTNRTDCPVEIPVEGQFWPKPTERPIEEVLYDDLKTLIKHVESKKNYQEALDTVHAATTLAQEMTEAEGYCNWSYCSHLAYRSSDLLKILMKDEALHPQILEIAEKWNRSDDMTAFKAAAKEIEKSFKSI